MGDEEVFEHLKRGSSEALSHVYQRYREDFISWTAARYSLGEDDARDIYQATILVFYENILTKKLIVLNSSIKTYLFSIGKNKVRELIRESSRYSGYTPEASMPLAAPGKEDASYHEQYYTVVRECLEELGDPGKSVLVSFYYKNYTMAEIAQAFNYKNEATAKNSKYKYLMRLKKCVFEKLGDEPPF